MHPPVAGSDDLEHGSKRLDGEGIHVGAAGPQRRCTCGLRWLSGAPPPLCWPSRPPQGCPPTLTSYLQIVQVSFRLANAFAVRPLCSALRLKCIPHAFRGTGVTCGDINCLPGADHGRSSGHKPLFKVPPHRHASLRFLLWCSACSRGMRTRIRMSG
jgi:hypothetical protein